MNDKRDPSTRRCATEAACPRKPRYMRPSTNSIHTAALRQRQRGTDELVGVHQPPSCVLTANMMHYHSTQCDKIDTSTDEGRQRFALLNCRYAKQFWPKVGLLIKVLQEKWASEHHALQRSGDTLHSYFPLKPAPTALSDCTPSHILALQKLYHEVVVEGVPSSDLGATPPAAATTTECTSCHTQTVVHRFVTICPKCHQQFESVTSKDRNVKEFEQCDVNRAATYKRINHFNEWLLRTQGIENRVVPTNVVEAVQRRMQLTSRMVTKDTPPKMAYDVVRSALVNSRFQDFFEHVPQIMRIVTPVAPPRLTREETSAIRHIFCSIQAPFDRHKPANRCNFLSYSYVIYKIAELLELDRVLPFCPLFKSVNNQRKADLIWKKICAELGYEFIPTV